MFGVVQFPASQQNLPFALAQVDFTVKIEPGSYIFYRKFIFFSYYLTKILYFQLVSLADSVIVCRVGEICRRDREIDQIGFVNPLD